MITEKYIRYLAQVLKEAVTNTAAPDMPPDIDEEQFIAFSAFHKVDNIVYLMLGDRLSEDNRARLEAAFNQSVMIQATQQYYLEEVENTFESSGVDYLILKGRELARLYPSEDMRQSSDFDIYIGRKNAPKARDIMLDIGFDIQNFDDSDDDHDEYVADKFVLCELHRVLIQDNYAWQTECNKITDRLILCEGTKHCFRMTPEDFYVYNLAHAAKHMKYSGVGIRVFLDQWLITKRMGDKIDWSKTEDILRRANLIDFDLYARELYEYWFEGKEPLHPQLIKEMEMYVAVSGWVGTQKQQTATELAEQAGKTNSKTVAKLRKCIEIICEPYEFMLDRYPILRKHRWLLPFCRIHRAFSAAIHKRELVKRITDNLAAGDMDEAKKIVSFKTSIGL